jgi:hypothetical protein
MEDGPPGDPAKGEKTFLPLHNGSKPSTQHNTGIWPHLQVRSSPEVGPGVSAKRIVVDTHHHMLGRLSSIIAKELLND